MPTRHAGYEGKRVVVTGGGGAGMGAATARLLVDHGAEVFVLDLRDPPPGVAGHFQTDLRDPGAIDAAVDRIGGTVHALFHSAGLQGRPFPPVDVVAVNFLSVRHLAGRLVPMMHDGGGIAATASGAAGEWQSRLEALLELITTADYATGRDWVLAHPDLVADDGYVLSKQALAVWVMWASADLGPLGVRINCTWPGYTDTPMLETFVAAIGEQYLEGYPRPIENRNATPEEQAEPLLFLNSPAASYVTGACLVVDGGYYAGVEMGRWGKRRRPPPPDQARP